MKDKPIRHADEGEPAAIFWTGTPPLSGERIKYARYSEEFPSFEAAVKGFMKIPPVKRDFAYIHTRSGERWVRAEIENLSAPPHRKASK